jgi:hypothetical protein
MPKPKGTQRWMIETVPFSSSTVRNIVDQLILTDTCFDLSIGCY